MIENSFCHTKKYMINKIRESNFELLRIISMIMIVALHYLNPEMGGALKYIPKDNLNYYIARFLESSCIIGVNCFVLISAYFLIEKNKVNINKIVKLMISLIFYGVLFFIIAIIIGKQVFDIKELGYSIIPFFAGRRWFVSTYIILFLFAPYINKVLNNISKKSFRNLLIIQFLLFSFWPTFLLNAPVKDGGYGIINFVFLYCIGAYIKLHYKKEGFDIKNIGILTFTILTTTIVSFFISGRVWSYNSVFNIIGSVALFLIFKNIKVKSNFINNISKYTFGVFLIHSDFMLQEFFYKDIMKCQNFYESKFFVLHFIICVIGSFVICTLIDFVKEYIFERTIYKKINKIKKLNIEISA